MQAVFFDLDGTLLDTLPDIHAVLNETLLQFGYPPVTRAEAQAYIGEGAHRLIERALPAGACTEACFEWFTAHYAASKNALTKPFGGIGELLASLGKRAKLAVITNKPQGATENCIAAFFPGRFDFVAGDSGAFPCKPDPSLARYAALKLHVSPKDCVFVGDGETDVMTARNAGMRGISVLWGYRTKEQLAAAGAREFVSTPEELAKILS